MKFVFIYLIFIISLFKFTLSINATCGKYSHLFTKEQYSIISKKRLRKEIRDYTYSEWEEIADAIWIMKKISTIDGQKIYGANYINYDRLLCKHMTASVDARGDQAHFMPGFILYHRAFCLEFERSLLAIKPSLKKKNLGLPYWDWIIDNDDPKNSLLFGEFYFGARNGNTSENYIVTNGKFKWFPVSRYNKTDPDRSCQIYTRYGHLRAPINPINNDYITRYGGFLCRNKPFNYTNKLGNITYFEKCMKESNISGWHYCIDPTVHATIHKAVGGTHKTQISQETIFNCKPWSGGVFSQKQKHYFFSRGTGCFYSHTIDCNISNPNDTPKECQLKLKQIESCLFIDLNVTVSVRKADYEMLIGDYFDPISSPNDPVFWFHHPFLDKYLYVWMLEHYDLAPFYGYPNGTEGYGDGANLLEVMSSKDPFINLFDNATHLQDSPLTAKDILLQTTFLNAPYTYPEILNLINPYCDDNETNTTTTNTYYDTILNHISNIMNSKSLHTMLL